MQIHDDRFLRSLSRRFIGRSRWLDGCVLYVHDYGSDVAGLEITITNTMYPVVMIAWVRDCASVVPGSTLMRAAHIDGLEDAFTEVIDRFLRRHGFINAQGRSTRKGVA